MSIATGAAAPVGFVKSHPVAALVTVLVLVVLAIKFQKRILSALGIIPVAGPRIAGLAAPAA